MQNPADKVVDGLRLGKRLMTTFMCYDPKTGGKKASEKAIKRPKGETCKGIEEWMGQSQLGRVDEWVKRDGGLVDASDGKHV
jgi:hypothetical protein